jgi:hypothetical protein
MIANLERGDASADLANDAGAFMPEDRGKNSLAVKTAERVGIGVTDSSCLDFDQDLSCLRAFQVDFDDLERLLCFECNSGAFSF